MAERSRKTAAARGAGVRKEVSKETERFQVGRHGPPRIPHL